MGKSITIANNAVTAKLVDADKEAKQIASAVLSYAVMGSEHMMAFKSGSWDGRSSFFDWRLGTFPAGFVPLLQTALKSRGYTVRRARSPLPAPLGKENFWDEDGLGLDPLYDYQPDVVNKLLKYGQMIAQIATGGGKSRVARLAYARINRPTLFLTTRGVLMYQMAEGFEPLGRKVAILGDGSLQKSNEVTCGMVQTIMSWLEIMTEEGELTRDLELIVNREDKEVAVLVTALEKRGTPLTAIMRETSKLRTVLEAKRPTSKEMVAKVKVRVARQVIRREKMVERLATFEFVILEEAHEASGNSFYEIMRHCKNAHYRLALTATPFMKDDEEANMRLMACSGPIGIEISEKLLIDRGILAKPYFKVIALKDKPTKLYRSTPWPKSYKVGITENEYRNAQIVKEAQIASKVGLTTMILVQHTKHGEQINELLRSKGIKSDYIHGEHDQKERKKALTKLATGETSVLIGTSILDVGVDVPAVGVIILAGGGKAEVMLRQRIGRGLRRKKNGKNVALIVDFKDEHNSRLKEHAQNRLHIIKNTPGFGENIMSPDFCFYRDLFLRESDRIASH